MGSHKAGERSPRFSQRVSLAKIKPSQRFHKENKMRILVALIAVALSNLVFSAAFLKLGDIKGESFKEVPPETECYAMADGKYQCKSPKAKEPIVMQCDKSVRLPKVVTIAEAAKQYPPACGHTGLSYL